MDILISRQSKASGGLKERHVSEGGRGIVKKQPSSPEKDSDLVQKQLLSVHFQEECT